MLRYKRTNLDGFPKTYLRFKAKDLDSDKLVEYRIQDLPEDRFEDALNFIFQDQYMKEEPFAKGFGLKDHTQARLEFEELYKKLFPQKLSIVCFKEGSDEIVALNVLFVLHESEYDLDFGFTAEPLLTLKKLLKYILSKSLPNEPSDENIMEGMGLSVDRKYRKRGIAVKMLEARLLIMKHIGVHTTSTIFTALGSQISAKKAGYTEYCEIPYDELIAAGFTFKDLVEKSVKTLGYQIQENH